MKSVAEPQSSSFRELEQDTTTPRPPQPSTQVVHEELERILSNHHFQTSKRCQAFLRYAVEQTLSGRLDLKERSIGVEVFDRPPTYDTNLDPVVRMTAGEVRKRLALYYQDSGKTSELHIELPIGSYVPRFHSTPIDHPHPEPTTDLPPTPTPEVAHPVDAASVAAPGLVPAPAPVPAPDPVIDTPIIKSPPPAPRRNLKLIGLAAILLLLIAGTIRWVVVHRDAPTQRTALDQFWEPLLASGNPVLISIGQIRPTNVEVQPNHLRSPINGPMQVGAKNAYPPQIAVAVLKDAIVMTDVAVLLKAHGKQFNIHPQSATTFDDLQRGPSVLIGAFDNDWTIMFANPLRFHFDTDATETATWIGDREHPDAKIGYLAQSNAGLVMKDDYGLVVRMYDPRTKQVVVIAAGLTPYATQSTGEFATDPVAIAEFAKRAPADWSHKNMEVLIKTDLIDGESGPPQIVATTFW
jgi:hypothetical protein